MGRRAKRKKLLQRRVRLLGVELDPQEASRVGLSDLVAKQQKAVEDAKALEFAKEQAEAKKKDEAEAKQKAEAEAKKTAAAAKKRAAKKKVEAPVAEEKPEPVPVKKTTRRRRVSKAKPKE